LTQTFKNWTKKNPAKKLTRTGFNTFKIIITPPAGTIQYKVTRGSWHTVEADAMGNAISNRTYNYSGVASIINMQVDGWEDIGGNGQTTATSNVHILDMNFPMPQLNKTRRVWVYLPPDYHTSSKKYPVLYMQDGQNLFDQYFTSFGEWEVDESLNTLFNQGDYGVIVVGIDNGGASRIDEYSPWNNPAYGGGQGTQYMNWMVNNLKPFIDSSFRTYVQPEYTGIMGSSMGALISQYGAVQYPQTFKKVGILSPAFWFHNSIFTHVHNTGVLPDMKFYFVSGTTESSSMVPLMTAMRDSVVNNGLSIQRTKLLTFADGQHSEWFWDREFPAAYQWLFSNLSLDISNSFVDNKNVCEVYPNPASDKISISLNNNQFIKGTELYSLDGKLLVQEQNVINTIDISELKAGVYLLRVVDEQGAVYNKKIVVQK